MSEIIEFPGNFNKNAGASENTSPQEGEIITHNFGMHVGEREIAGRRYTTIGVDPEKMLLAAERLALIQKYLNSLQVTASNETTALRQEIVKEYSNKDLVDHIINSSELEWQEKPTFYAAVLLEFAERMREILS